MTTFLLHGDALASRELRHEIGEPVMDPVTFIEHEGRRIVVGSVLEESIFEARCQSCHSLEGDKLTGPPLNGTKRDDAYLLESILKPDAKIAPGYQPGIMSRAVPAGSVSEQDANKLVAFIKQQK